MVTHGPLSDPPITLTNVLVELTVSFLLEFNWGNIIHINCSISVNRPVISTTEVDQGIF